MKRTASVPTIHRGADDPTLTGHAGLLLVRDLNSKLQLVARLNSSIESARRFKCRRRGLRFCVVVPRYQTMWEARRHLSPMSWRPAQEMVGAEVAERPIVPTGWEGEPLRLLVRRVRVEEEEISQSPKSRRRRTIPKQQLRLALRGALGHTFSYSFIVTDLPGDAVELEHWQRRRAHIEERIKDLKLGCGLLHLPLRKRRANRAWQTAVVITSNLTAMLSAVNVCRERQKAEAAAGGTLSPEQLAAVGRPHHTAVLRRWLLTVPARLVRSGRTLYLRLAQGMFHKQEFWALHRHILDLAPPDSLATSPEDRPLRLPEV